MRQKTRFRNHLIFASALLLIFALLSLSLKRSTVLRTMEGLVVTVTAPGLQGIHYLGRSLNRLWYGYIYLVGLERENEVLKRRLDEAIQKEATHQEALAALQRLEALLDLRRQVALPVSSARVIAYDPSLWSRCVILDHGRSSGIKPGLPVVAPRGIAGRVVEAYPGYAKVMLIVDRNSGADALVQRSRVRGILQGKGANRCSLEYVPKKADVQVGDLVISSGLNGVFPQGLIFGRVSGADKKTPGVFQEIEVTPAVDLSALEEVLVVKTAELLPPS